VYTIDVVETESEALSEKLTTATTDGTITSALRVNGYQNATANAVTITIETTAPTASPTKSPVTASAATSNTDASASKEVVIGAVIAAVVGSLLILACFYYFYRGRGGNPSMHKRGSKAYDVENIGNPNFGVASTNYSRDTVHPELELVYSDSNDVPYGDNELPFTNIMLGKLADQPRIHSMRI
jgi:hypothetical protein